MDSGTGHGCFDDDHRSVMTRRAHPQEETHQRLHMIAIVRTNLRVLL